MCDEIPLIYLARHGQTPGNIELVIKDPFKDPLTVRGQQQANLLGQDLADVKFTRVYCSDYPRAVQTAKIVMENSKSAVELRTDARLREWDDSKFQGKSYNVINELKGKGIESNHPYAVYSQFCVEGLEPVEKIISRLESFFDELFDDLDKCTVPERILIVSHGVLIRIFMMHIHQSKKYEANCWTPELVTGLENCAFHKFTVSKQQRNNENSSPRILDLVKIHKDDHLLC